MFLFFSELFFEVMDFFTGDLMWKAVCALLGNTFSLLVVNFFGSQCNQLFLDLVLHTASAWKALAEKSVHEKEDMS